MKKKWVLKELNNESAHPVSPGTEQYPGLIARLLSLRGLDTPEKIDTFLNPSYEKLHDPFLFFEMQKACKRIRKAIEEKQKIVIYADYDADAITASSVMTLGLRKLGGIVDCYIPDRFSEGYGMNVEAVKKLKDEGAGLVITVDCGTNSIAEAEECLKMSLDLIITDHHEITGDLPKAFALINPKNPEDNYPFKYLTGVGVAFKVMQALFSEQLPNDVPPGWEKWLLDLVAIGTVADLQSLESENRIMVKYGLQVLGKSKWPGVQALMEVSKIPEGKYTTYTLGFMLAPRINAAGRIKHADAAYKMLVAGNIEEARVLAQDLDLLNTKRQTLTEQILSEAREQILLLGDKKVLLAAGRDWPKGVVGLVAGKLAEEFNKPVLIMDRGEESATGSGRSHAKFDLVKALIHAKDLLTKFGGHTQAAGFTLPSKDVENFYAKLLEFAETLDLSDADPVLEIDAELSSEDINWDFYAWLEKFEPFGFGNPRPKFLGKGLEIVELRAVGGQSQHLKTRLLWNGKVISGISFRQGFLAGKLKADQPVDVVFELEANHWQGNKNLEMKIIDIKQGENQ